MILVTGATGFLGSELLLQLHQNNCKVRALYRTEARIPTQFINKENISWAQADINDVEAMGNALEGVTQVYHCAAQVEINEKIKKQQFFTNINGTANLVNLCLERPHIRLLHVSSIAALGMAKNNALIGENCHWEYTKNASVYGISKYESEIEVWRGIAEGLNAVIVNPALIIGGTGEADLGKSIINMLRKGLSYYPTGGIGLVDVKDVVACMRLLMNADVRSERYILSAENYTYQQFFKEIAQASGLPIPAKKVSHGKLQFAYYMEKIWCFFSRKKTLLTKDILKSCSEEIYLDNHKIKAQLDFQFRPISQTIQETCNPTV